jgi:hypothetical protein
MQAGCRYNFLICEEHKELNKAHPWVLKCNSWVQERKGTFPTLDAVGVKEFVLMTRSSDMPAYDSGSLSAQAQMALATYAYTINTLFKKHDDSINATTIYPVCQQQLLSAAPRLP